MKYAIIILLFWTNQSSAQIMQDEWASQYPHRLNLWDYSSANYHWQNQITKIKNASIKSSSYIYWNRKSKQSDTIQTFYKKDGTLSDSSYSFDDENRLTKMFFQKITIGHDSLPDTTDFQYRIAYLSNRILIDYTFLTDSICLNTIYTYQYNEHGHLIMDSSISEQIHSSLPSISVVRYTYNYDGENRPISREHQLNGILQRQEYIYSKNQKIIRTIIETPYSYGYQPKHPLVYYDGIFTYDSLQRVVKTESVKYDAETGKIFKMFSSYAVFNEFGYNTEIKARGVHGYKEYKFDRYGNPLSFHGYRKIIGIFKRISNTFEYKYEYY